ncbi:alanine:cation symporter family protein [Saccharopolyspora shandongensis]
MRRARAPRNKPNERRHSPKPAIVQGVRRGMFSNEAGLGSAPNAGESNDAGRDATRLRSAAS